MANKLFDLKQEIDNIFMDKKLQLAIGNKAREVIVRRVKSGFGVTDDSSSNPRKVRLKALSERYIKRRRNLRLGPYGKPSRSNLTMTGQMLNAILVASLKRKGIRLTVNKKRRSDGKTNEEVAFFSSLDRPWFSLTVAEQRILADFIRENIKHKLRRI